MVKDDRLELAIKNTPKPLRLFKSIKNRYEDMTLKKIKELKQIGILDVKLEGIHPKIAFEMSEQLCKLARRYGCYIEWFGTTEELDDINYKGQVEYKTYQNVLKHGLSEEDARKIAIASTKKLAVPDNQYGYYHHQLELYSKSGPMTINAVSINMNCAKSYNKLCESMKKDVNSQYHPPYADTPSFILTHEFGHAISYYLNNIGILDIEMAEVAYSLFETRAEELCRYGTMNFSEFVAEAFAESIHNPNPRTIAKFIRSWIDKAVADLRKEKAIRFATAFGPAPKFIKSEWFVAEPGNWHLKPGAPKEVEDEFNKFMKQHKAKPFIFKIEENKIK